MIMSNQREEPRDNMYTKITCEIAEIQYSLRCYDDEVAETQAIRNIEQKNAKLMVLEGRNKFGIICR